MSQASKANLDNQQIIALLKKQDVQAIGMLYHKYAGALLHFIRKMIPTNELAEEVLQDVFVKIWKKAGQYDESKGRLFTWMVQIARNTAIDKLRSGQFLREEKTVPLEKNVTESKTPVQIPVLKDSGLRRVVDQLDDRYSQLIDYVYFQGFTQKETSEALDIPLGTVKSRVRKAITQLRKILSKEQLMLIATSFLIEFFT